MFNNKDKAVFDEDNLNERYQFEIVFGIVVFIILAYMLGYLCVISHREEIGLLDAFMQFPSRLKSGHLFFNPFARGAFTGMIYAAILSVVMTFLLHVDNDRHANDNKKTVKGSAHFMTKREWKEYNEKYLKDPEDGKVHINDEKDNHIILSKSYRRPINSRKAKGNNNVAVIGTAGSGKSRGYIIPNILQMNSSYVITDPSGEVLATVGNLLKDNGYKIKLFNTSEMQYSNRYNPLHYIRDDTGVAMVIQCLIDNTEGQGKKGDEFWTKAEKLMYMACIYYLRDFCQDESKRNFASVMSMINSSKVDENDANAKSDLDNLFDALPEGAQAKKYYRAFKQAAGKTLKSIIISCVTRLQPFMMPSVINLTKYDNLELEKLGDEKTALFIITPQADHTFAFLSAMLYNQIFETLYHKGEQQKAKGGSERLKYPVQCLMDEFANIGTIPEFPSKLSTMRKYNINATVVLQDTAQLETLYEKAEAQTLEGNCSTIIFLGTSEQEDLKKISEMLGKRTSMVRNRTVTHGGGKGPSQSYQVDSRELMTPDELAAMDPEECIVFSYTNRPVKDGKYDMFTHHNWEFCSRPENVFKYTEVDAYNTSSLDSEGDMIAALQGAARVEREMRKNPAGEFQQAIGKIMDTQAVLDCLSFDQETEERAQDILTMDAIEQAMGQSKKDVVCLSRKGLSRSQMMETAHQVAETIGKYPVIITGTPDQDGLVQGYITDADRGCGIAVLKANSGHVADVRPLGNDAFFRIAPKNIIQLASMLETEMKTDRYMGVY